MSAWKKSLLAGAGLLVLSGLMLIPMVRAQGGGSNVLGDPPLTHLGETPIDLGTDPTGVTTSSGTSDCATCFLGYSDERWDFTLTQPQDVMIEVNDCCVPGDRFEARINNRAVDEDMDTDLNNHEEDCIAGRQPVFVPPGTFDILAQVTLDPGDWSVRVRDVAFQCDDQTTLCAAGYDVRLTFMAPTGAACAALAPCTDIATGDPTCQDQAGGQPAPTGGPLALGLLVLLLLGISLIMLQQQRTA